MNRVAQIEIPQRKVAEFCRRHGIRKLSFFGSVLREDFVPESDVDVLVEFEPGRAVGLITFAGMELELSEILGRKVDLVDRGSVEHSENYIRRKHILASLEPIYVAG